LNSWTSLTTNKKLIGTDDEGATWKLGAIILAVGIGYVGMTGGKLQYPSNHYKDLNALWTEMIGANEQDELGVIEPAESEMDKDEMGEGEMQEGEILEGDLNLNGQTLEL